MRKVLTLPHGRRKAALPPAANTACIEGPGKPRPRPPNVAADTCQDCCDLAWTTTAAFQHSALQRLRSFNTELSSGDDSIHRFCCLQCGQHWNWSARRQWQPVNATPALPSTPRAAIAA